MTPISHYLTSDYFDRSFIVFIIQAAKQILHAASAKSLIGVQVSYNQTGGTFLG